MNQIRSVESVCDSKVSLSAVKKIESVLVNIGHFYNINSELKQTLERNVNRVWLLEFRGFSRKTTAPPTGRTHRHIFYNLHHKSVKY